MVALQGAIFASPVDLADEGTATVLGRVQQQAGVGAVTLACAYHAARDLLPHNPRRTIVSLESGVTYFPPDQSRYAGTPLRPQVSKRTRGRDMLAESITHGARLGLDINAWVVLTHNSRLAARHSRACVQTAFGDRLTHGLCPSHEDVQLFGEALVGEVADRAPAAVYLESADFPGYDHGGHHERTLVRLDRLARLLLGLCFCPACTALGTAAGLDVPGLKRAVRRYLRAAFEQEAADPVAHPDPGRIPQLSDYLRVRQDTVVRFATRLAAAVRERSARTRVVLLDVSAAPDVPTAFERGRWNGLDLTRLAAIVDGIAFTAYTPSVSAVRDLTADYRALARAVELEGVLRPGWPDSDSAADLRAKVTAVTTQGTGYISFYHYGLMRLSALDWIRTALVSG
jgi:hypothetical protein